MKKVFVILVCIVLFASGTAISEEKQSPASEQQAGGASTPSMADIDARFKTTNEWLKQGNLSVTTSPQQAFVNDYILVVAEGLPSATAKSPAQKRLTAERAATALAYRELAEILEGVAVVGDTLVKDAELQYDVVRIAVTGFVKGARIVHKEYNDKEESALVVVKIGMTGPGSFADALYAKILKPDVKKELIESQSAPQFKQKPVPLDEKYDGLVIDATDQNFRPALINRIFTPKGETLYDPSKISQKVLVEQGCGEYTNSLDKARAALETREVKNPLIVKASGTVSPSDLQVSDDDAIKIFSANQKAGFLAGAKVAFVLK